MLLHHLAYAFYSFPPHKGGAPNLQSLVLNGCQKGNLPCVVVLYCKKHPCEQLANTFSLSRSVVKGAEIEDLSPFHPESHPPPSGFEFQGTSPGAISPEPDRAAGNRTNISAQFGCEKSRNLCPIKQRPEQQVLDPSLVLHKACPKPRTAENETETLLAELHIPGQSVESLQPFPPARGHCPVPAKSLPPRDP